MGRVLGNPKLGCGVAVVLLVDLLVWVSTPFHFAWLGLPFYVLLAPWTGGSRRFDAPTADIWRSDGQLVLVQRGDSIAAPSGREVEYLGLCDASVTPWSVGLAAPVRTQDDVDFYAFTESRELSGEDLGTIREQYAVLLSAWKHGKYAGTDYPALIIAGGGHYQHWSMPALIHDAIYLLCLPIALSGVWVAARRWRRDVLDVRRRAIQEALIAAAESGRCPFCSYDITGLMGRCPECGKDIPTHQG